jgi:hypothetical protein
MCPNLSCATSVLDKHVITKSTIDVIFFIFNAIQEFSEQGRYGVIFDKSSDLLMLYADENLDKSEKILDYLGYDY